MKNLIQNGLPPAATAKDGGSAGNAGAIYRPTAKDGGSAGNAGAIHRPASILGQAPSGCGTISGNFFVDFS